MEGIRDWGGKLAGATLRLAAVLHCVKHGPAGRIDIEHQLVVVDHSAQAVIDEFAWQGLADQIGDPRVACGFVGQLAQAPLEQVIDGGRAGGHVDPGRLGSFTAS